MTDEPQDDAPDDEVEPDEADLDEVEPDEEDLVEVEPDEEEPPGDAPAPPEEEALTADRMMELIDEALGDEEDEEELDFDIEIDDEAALPSPEIDAIISSASLPVAGLTDLDEEAVADDEEEREDRWGAVTDLDEPDTELEVVDDLLPDQPDPWADVQDEAEPDLLLEPELQEHPEDPWGPVGSGPALGPTLAVVDHAPLQLPPPAPLAGTESEPAARTGPRHPLPWRGRARLLGPDLPELMYVADVARERTVLLVASWAWADDEPGARRLRLRLADDGPEVEVETAAPHEAAMACEIEIEGRSLPARVAVVADRSDRGLHIGRDVLATRFVVDPSTAKWPEDDDEAAESL